MMAIICNYFYCLTQNGGSYVLAVDAGREAILSVWQWQWGHLLGKVAVSFKISNIFVTPFFAFLIYLFKQISYIFTNIFTNCQTMQEDLTGAAFHPLDDNLLITHGRGHLTFWNRRKDGFFERTDIIKPVSLKIMCLKIYVSINNVWHVLYIPVFNSYTYIPMP